MEQNCSHMAARKQRGVTGRGQGQSPITRGLGGSKVLSLWLSMYLPSSTCLLAACVDGWMTLDSDPLNHVIPTASHTHRDVNSEAEPEAMRLTPGTST
jgi:hypothetical protein